MSNLLYIISTIKTDSHNTIGLDKLESSYFDNINKQKDNNFNGMKIIMILLFSWTITI